MIAKSFAFVALALSITFMNSSLHAAYVVNVATPSRVIFAIPFWIAEHKGYFKDEGIEAKLEIVASGRQLSEQLRSGATHTTIVGPDAAIIDASKGGPMRVLAGIVRRPPLFLIAKPSIKTFADLRGANIGVLSLTKGSSKLLAKMLKAEGVSPADLKISAVGGAPARWTLLQEGKIDAGMQPLPLIDEAVTAGFTNLGWAGKYEPDWQFTTVNANSEWTSRNPELAAKFVRALLRGQQFLFANPDEAAKIAAIELKTPAALAARSLKEAMRLGILDPKLDWSEVGLTKMYENMQADGVMPADQKLDLGKVLNAEFLRKAQSAAGIR